MRLGAKGERIRGRRQDRPTPLQDATPLTVGQEMSGWASLLARDIERLKQSLDGLYRPSPSAARRSAPA